MPEAGVFRWHAAAGRFTPNLMGTIARDASPCGAVLDRDAALLFVHPERHYPYPAPVDPPIVETLLVPFHAGGRPVGTVWAVAHTPDRRFDAEDARLVTRLTGFAAARQTVATLDAAEAARAGLERQVAARTAELAAANDRLRLAQEAGRVGIFDWDVAPGRSVWIKVQEAIYGLPPGGFEGTNQAWAGRVHPDDRALVEAELGWCLGERRAEIEFDYRVVRADGAVRWVTNRGRTAYDPAGRRCEGSGRPSTSPTGSGPRRPSGSPSGGSGSCWRRSS